MQKSEKHRLRFSGEWPLKAILCPALAASLWLPMAGVAEAEAVIGLSAGSDRVTVRARTLQELRDEHVVKQKFDYSCGAAALATLLNFYFSDPVPERAILLEMLNALPPAERADRVARGFTLLDLKDEAARHGYTAEGAVLSLDSLPKLGGPVIVYLEIDGARHFAVFRGVQEDRVYLADPNRGNVRVDVRRFAKEWPGVVLALGRRDGSAPEKHFLAVKHSSNAAPELLTARQAVLHLP